jgi:hypothetical protein
MAEAPPVDNPPLVLGGRDPLTALTFAHKDPALLGFPPLLPVELALAETPVREVCESYGITDRDEFARIVKLPAFQKAFSEAQKMLQQEGMSFRVKARLQSEALLETSFALIHAQHTPSNVKADLIKSTWKVAGLEPKETAISGTPLQININL